MLPLGADTGSPTFVTPETASRLHLDQDLRSTRVQGTTNAFTANNVLIRDLEFAGDHYRRKSVPTIKILHVNTFGKEPLAGLLGADIFSAYDLEFDFAKSALTLFKVRGCTEMTPPWTGTYSTVPLKITQQHRITMPVELNGTKLRGVFDTGAAATTVFEGAALKAGVTSAALKNDPLGDVVGAGNYSIKAPFHEFEMLEAAGLRLTKIRLSVLKSPNDADLLLGRDFMASNRFWISHATGTLFVQQPERPNFPGETGAVWYSGPLIERMLENHVISLPAPAMLPAGHSQPAPRQTCDLGLGASARLSGQIISFHGVNEVLDTIQRTQRKTNGAASPAYTARRAVRLETMPATGRPPIVLIPNTMTAQAGDIVEYETEHVVPDQPCSYVPDLIERVIAHAEEAERKIPKGEAEGTAETTVRQEGTAPAVQILWPHDGAKLDEHWLSVGTRIIDRGGGIGKMVWKRNGRVISSGYGSTTLSADGRWTVSFDLIDADTEIEFFAEDKFGNQSAPAMITVHVE
ncbi:MAG: pepsin/retropepsin-like aspartic protease family protein [Rhodomicrobium sp.]